ncbi:MAG: polysaccharide biosynthesis protein [Firmicutes bacterium]|nr:polysaccharide biosynthesis protein [Bacillota bacterium]
MDTKKNNRFKKLFGGKNKKIIVILLLDIIFAAGAFLLARVVYFAPGTSYDWFERYAKYEILIAAVCVFVTVAMLVILDSYNTVWKYAGRVEFFKIVFAYLASAGVLFILDVIVREAMGIAVQPALIVMYLTFSLILSSILRYGYGIRSFFVYLKNKLFQPSGDKKDASLLRTVVIGAGFTGTAFINRCFNNPDEGYFPVALLDDNPEKQKSKVYGVQVMGGLSILEDVVKKYRADAIVIAIILIDKARLRAIYTECLRCHLPIKIVSALRDAGAGDLANSALALRDIKAEELLGRDEFKVNRALLDEAVRDKTVLVTGGAGSIGSELCRQALRGGCKRLVVFDMHENGMFELGEEFKGKFDKGKYSLVIGNVRERARVKEVLEKFRPDIVFHAAAYKHVPMMEFSATEAVKNNVFGTLNVIRESQSANVKRFIFISTDKAVNPANIMGASKRIAEMLVQDIGKSSKMQMAAVRFGNVLGSTGSVIPTFLRQIQEGGPITLTDRYIRRYFMTIPESVRLVLQAGSLAKQGDVFVLNMGEPVFIYDLACELIRLNGLSPEKDIEIRITGLREGEKMFEELRYDKETVDETSHEGIFVTRLAEIDSVKFRAQVKKLEAYATGEYYQETADMIFEMVPSEYRTTSG